MMRLHSFFAFPSLIINGVRKSIYWDEMPFLHCLLWRGFLLSWVTKPLGMMAMALV